jgi:hypothetical protein
VSDVQDDPVNRPQHESFARHPIHATAEEAEHLREVADEGKSPRTPAIIVASVLAVVLPLAAIYIFVAFAVMHFA